MQHSVEDSKIASIRLPSDCLASYLTADAVYKQVKQVIKPS